MKNTNAQIIEYRRLREAIVSDDRHTELICIFSVPYLRENKIISDFYAKATENCREFCRQKLIKKLSNNRRNEDNRQYTYRLSSKAETCDELLYISLSASLYDGFSRKRISCKKFTHLWDTKRGRLTRENSKKTE